MKKLQVCHTLQVLESLVVGADFAEIDRDAPVLFIAAVFADLAYEVVRAAVRIPGLSRDPLGAARDRRA